MASDINITEIGATFVDIAEDYDTWNVDFSLSLFRKKLKIIGEKITGAFSKMDVYLEAKIQEVLADIQRRQLITDAAIVASSTALTNKVTEASSSSDTKIAALAADIKKLKDATHIIASNLDILIKNDGHIKTALNDIYKRLKTTESVSINEISGGSAVN